MSRDRYITLDGVQYKVPEANNSGRNYDALADFIINEEGFLKEPTDIGDGKITLGSGLTDPKWHKLYRMRGNVWSAEDNKRAVIEEIKNREHWLEDNFPNWSSLSPQSQNALISYKYNYNFTPSNSPRLFNAAQKRDYYGIATQMDATSKDPKFREGLMARRKREQELFLSGAPRLEPSVHIIEQSDATRISTPYQTYQSNTVIAPTVVPNKGSYTKAHRLSQAEDRTNRFKEAVKAANDYNSMMQSVSIQNNPAPQFEPRFSFKAEGGFLQPRDAWDTLSMREKAEMMKIAVNHGIYNLSDIRQKYNEFAEGGSKEKEEEVNTNSFSSGGSIHIKPSHRGRLTELKKRTGKTEAELYRTGSPATRKMITFARSARKWHKHDLGGYLQGQVYDLSEEEIMRLIDAGYEIEYL